MTEAEQRTEALAIYSAALQAAATSIQNRGMKEAVLTRADEYALWLKARVEREAMELASTARMNARSEASFRRDILQLP